jgi:hypothetical protein
MDETIEEWETEPDHMEFTIRGMSYIWKPHKKKRLRKKYRQKYGVQRKMITLHCEIRRHPEMLHLCGYVSVPQQHLWWGRRYDKIDVNVHGGLTFGRKRNKSFEYGFDCAHFMDCVPGMEIILKKIGGNPMAFLGDTYRNMPYVTREIISLANQLLITREVLIKCQPQYRTTQESCANY